MSLPNAEHDDPWMMPGLETADIREVQVERDEDSFLSLNDFGESVVVDACHSLLDDRQRVVTCLVQALCYLGRHVFVDLEPHYAAPGRNGITSSRVSSAAYETAARTSSALNDG